jgi:hypothetical protein
MRCPWDDVHVLVAVVRTVLASKAVFPREMLDACAATLVRAFVAGCSATEALVRVEAEGEQVRELLDRHDEEVFVVENAVVVDTPPPPVLASAPVRAMAFVETMGVAVEDPIVQAAVVNDSTDADRPSAVKEEQRRWRLLVARLRDAKVGLVMCQKIIPPFLAQLLEESGISCLQKLSRRHFPACCILAGCVPLEDWNSLIGRERLIEEHAGWVGSCLSCMWAPPGCAPRTVVMGADSEALRSARPRVPISTVCVQGDPLTCEALREAVIVSLKQAIDSLRVCLSHPLVVPGAGAADMAIAFALKGAAVKLREARLFVDSRVVETVARSVELVAASLGGGFCACVPGSDSAERCALCHAFWLGRSVVRLEEGDDSCRPSSVGVRSFPRFDGESPPRCGEGETVIVRAESLVELGTIARASLAPGSRVVLTDKTGMVAAMVLCDGGTRLPPLDLAWIKQRAIVRAIRSTETILRCDGEISK